MTTGEGRPSVEHPAYAQDLATGHTEAGQCALTSFGLP